MPTAAFKNAFSIMQGTVRKQVQRTVTVSRGTDTFDVVAGIGGTEFEVVNAEGVVDRFEAKDFLIRTVDYDFGSGAVEPEVGDTLRYTEGTQTLTYECIAPAPEPAWRYSDRFRLQLRIHSKLITVA